ncbi:MAG: ATP-binding protein [Clostridia bacterium]|nr:ATP-binding protein [Clostridia bacterium]
MKELSLNILDIAQNSITARSTLIKIELVEEGNLFTLTISDNGCGMSPEMVESVTDPFCTTRKTRKVGLGIPFLKMQAEMTGGSFSISSKSELEYPLDHGTVTKASFYKDHIDFTPLGDIISSLCTLIHGAGDIDILFTHKTEQNEVALDTRELKEVLGEGISLAEPEILSWIEQYLSEQYNSYK